MKQSFYFYLNALLLIILFCPNCYFSQIQLIDFATKKPIKNLEFLINDEIKLKSNKKGIIKFEAEQLEKITALNGEYDDFFINNETITENTLVLNPIKTRNMDEILLKEVVFNDYLRRRKVLGVSMQSGFKEQTILVEQEFDGRYKIKKTMFFLEEVRRGSELKFVIYKKTDGVFAQVFSKLNNQLRNKENEMLFNEDALILEKGIYCFGIEWVINDKTKTVMSDILKINVSGFDVEGFYDKDIKEQFYFFSKSKNRIKEAARGRLAIKLVAIKL